MLFVLLTFSVIGFTGKNALNLHFKYKCLEISMLVATQFQSYNQDDFESSKYTFSNSSFVLWCPPLSHFREKVVFSFA